MTDPGTIIGIVSILLFVCGLGALLLRRHLIAMLLGVELMLNAANLNLVFYGRQFNDAGAWSAVLWVLAAAAAEAVIGLTLILALSRYAEAETEQLKELKG